MYWHTRLAILYLSEDKSAQTDKGKIKDKQTKHNKQTKAR